MDYERSPAGLYLPRPCMYKPGISWPMGGSVAPFAIGVGGNEGDVTDAATYTTAALAYGLPPDGNRLVTALITGRTNGGATASGTIGGVTATVDVERYDTGASNPAFGLIMSAVVPSGTSGVIFIDFGARVYRELHILVMSITGLKSTTSVETASDVNGTTLTLSGTHPATGQSVALMCGGEGDATGTIANSDYSTSINIGGSGAWGHYGYKLGKDLGTLDHTISDSGLGSNAAGVMARWE